MYGWLVESIVSLSLFEKIIDDDDGVQTKGQLKMCVFKHH